MTSSDRAIRLKITLREVEPPVWRRFVVPAEMTLHDLNDVIQVLYGWADYHLYNFTINGQRYEKLRPDLDQPDVLDTCSHTLANFLPELEHFGYMYDFGDCWTHILVVEAIEDGEREHVVPHCLEGGNAGPPVDVGGVTGYEDFLRTINDPDADAHEHLSRWVSSYFQIPFGRIHTREGEELTIPPEKESMGEEPVAWNPHAFDEGRINRDLKEIHWWYQKRLAEGSREYDLTGLRVPDEYKEMVLDFFSWTDQFCGIHLDGDPEYVRLFHRAAVKLARKRPSPLQRGRFDIWVGGIIFGIGSANFLFDSDEDPYVSSKKVSEQMDIPLSTLRNKGKRVRDELNIKGLKTEWMRKDFIFELAPLWRVYVDDELRDARRLGNALYNQVREKGLIPDLDRTRFPRGGII